MLEEINFIIFDRKGFDGNTNFDMPKKMLHLKSDQNLIGMISSTEVRRRIKEAREEA